MLGRYRFYNAGEKWSFSLAYSIPSTPDTADDVHCVAHYEVVCPAEGWFEVPDELNVGGALIQVRFAQYLTQNFGDRGIVMLDRNRSAEEIGATEAVGASEAGAIEKAKELWLAYLNGVATQHLDWCSRVRAAGNSPPAATGFTKRALKRLGIADPADVLLEQLRVKQPEASGGAAEVDELREIVRRQGEMLEKLLAAGNGNGRGGQHEQQHDLELKGKGK